VGMVGNPPRTAPGAGLIRVSWIGPPQGFGTASGFSPR